MKKNVFFILMLCLSGVGFAQDLENAYDFEGIVKLSNCSGSIVKFNGQPDTAKALVMTNGHCVAAPTSDGFLKPGQVMVNYPVQRSFRIFDSRMNKISATSTKITFATMTNTDVAFYELTATYEDLENQGISALVLSSEHSTMGSSIEIISGYWERGYACKIDGFVYQMKEALWTWKDSIRYSQPGCETIGGTSGSPIIAKGERVVLGINNTGNEDGQKCTMNNPCEIDTNGNITVHHKVNYGQQVYQIYSCLTVDYQVDLKKEGCLLPKPQQFVQPSAFVANPASKRGLMKMP